MRIIPVGLTFPTTTLTITTPGPGVYSIDIPNPNSGTWRVYSTDPACEHLPD